MKTIDKSVDLASDIPAAKKTGAHLPYFEIIWNWNLKPVIQRALKDGLLTPESAEASAEEYRRFLFLVAVSKRTYAMTSKEVDAVWHTHILHTRDYTALCNELFGGYLHHEPGDAEVGSTSLNVEEANEFYQQYQNFFWPRQLFMVIPHKTVLAFEALHPITSRLVSQELFKIPEQAPSPVWQGLFRIPLDE